MGVTFWRDNVEVMHETFSVRFSNRCAEGSARTVGTAIPIGCAGCHGTGGSVAAQAPFSP